MSHTTTIDREKSALEGLDYTSFQPWALSAEETIQVLQSNAVRGLTEQEAAKRLERIGANEIPERPPEPLWRRYWAQLTGDAVVRLLLIGAVASLLLADYFEGVAILLMLNIMAGFGLWQEGRATDAARSLRRLDNPEKIVIRDGTRRQIGSDKIVPGDIIYLPTGAVAPADGRIIAAVNGEKDTSALTGESLSVSIELEPLAAKTVINGQKNMIHRGNAVVKGNMTVIVTATGGQTEIGQIAETLSQSEDNKTPLDEQLDQLGDAMAKILTWIAVIVIGFGIVRELFNSQEPLNRTILLEILREAFINGVALIIAAIPEGLPAVLTITLAIATRLMVSKNALIRKMKAVEGAGSMTVLLSDKTGTLTTNQMEVTHLYLNGRLTSVDEMESLPQESTMRRVVTTAKLCNNGSDPTENALLRWVELVGLQPTTDIIQKRKKEHEFDQSLKRMTTVYRSLADDKSYHILTKGAPEQVLQLCRFIHLDGQDVPLTEARIDALKGIIQELASRGLRVIALADRIVSNGHLLARAAAESDLTLLGITAIMDPPREDVPSAIATLAKAGIRTVMVTGDNPLTAYEIARQIGIIKEGISFDEAVLQGEELTDLAKPTEALLKRLRNVRVFARVTPKHKAEIVQNMKEAGFIVGMTGDGVNDAIALKESDVGIAMGNGTDVAREASDLVLMNSRFRTIPIAVEEGRNVLYRIRLYLSYILSGNGCEVGAFIVAYIFNLPIPLTALMLLIINFATDSFPALAMAFELGEKDVMEQPPRRRETPFINRTMWIHITIQTIVATVIIMGVYYYYLNVVGTSLDIARGAAFMTYITQKLYRAFTARSLTQNIWEIGLWRNQWTIAAVGISLAIALFFVYMPIINTAVGMAALSAQILFVTAIVGLLPPIVEEITKLYLKRYPL